MAATTKSSAAIAAIIVSVIIGTVVLFVAKPGGEEVCSTRGCVNAAARILNSMDTSADPCDDFFRYTCGGWIDANPIPDNRATFGVHNVVEDANEETLRVALTSEDSGDRDAIKKVKKFYRTCMNEEALERLDAQPALDFIASLGGMPMFGDAFDEENFSLETELATSPSSLIVTKGVTEDDKNSTRHVIWIDQPWLGMSAREYYFEPEFNETLSAYRQYMEQFLEALWKSKDESESKSTYDRDILEEAVDEILRLETELAEALEPITERLDYAELHRKFSLEEMSTNVSADFNWLQFTAKWMSTVNYTVTPDTTIVSYGTPYLTKFMSILKKYDNRVLKNYHMWINLHRMVNFMSDRFRDTKAVYRKATTGTDEEEPRWKRCMDWSNSYFKLPIGSIFVEKLFSKESKSEVTAMLKNVVKYFRQNLQTLEWMDEETTAPALSKVNSLGEMLAYPDYIIDEKNPKLDEDFESLNIPEDEYYLAVKRIGEFEVKKVLKKITKPVLRYSWEYQGPSEVNAYYDLVRNLMVFPAGFMQAPYFDEYQPFSMNYGGIGSTIGHELTHGFDTGGSQFNENGNLENWWSNMSKKHFDEKAQCVRDQYSGFYFDTAEMFVNGNQTVAENIADIAGTRLAYQGYKLWKETSGKIDFKLPGLEHLTSEQLFFISYGLSWCGSSRKERAQNRIKTGVHSPYIFRVNGVAMNLPKFGQAFGCKKGEDKLFPDPEKTCRVW